MSDGEHRRRWFKTGGLFAGFALAISTVIYGAASNLLSDIAFEWWDGRDSTELATQQTIANTAPVLTPVYGTSDPTSTFTIESTQIPSSIPTVTSTPDSSCRDSITGKGIRFPDEQVFGQEWANPSWWAQGQYLESTGVIGETVSGLFTLSSTCSNLITVGFSDMNYETAMDGAGLIFYLSDDEKTRSMAIGLARSADTGEFDQIVVAVNEDLDRQSWVIRDCVSVLGVGSSRSISVSFRVTQTGVQVIHQEMIIGQFVFAQEIGSGFSPTTMALSSRFEGTRITLLNWVVEGDPEPFPMSIAGAC